MLLEVETLEKQLTQKKERTIQGIRFTTGRLQERAVVLAYSGIGKVNAAVSATLLIDQLRPSHVIFTGIAGGINPDLGPGDIVIGARTAYHDYGELTPRGFQVGPTKDPRTGKQNPLFFPADAGLLTAAEKVAAELKLSPLKTRAGARTPQALKGVIVTGDVFVAAPAKKAELRKDLKADAIEMEGAAVAQICWQQRVPCLILRGLSDSADDRAEEDYRAFAKTAAHNSALLVLGILARLEPR
jgi:adenosylhomocysteine nucleosidase